MCKYFKINSLGMGKQIWILLSLLTLTACDGSSDDNNSESASENQIDYSLLWQPERQKTRVQNNLNLFNDERKIRLVTFNEWSVPIDPTWLENPYGDKSWELYYHSLGWLYAPLLGYEESGNSDYLHLIKEYIFDWISDNESPPRSAMAWNDHSIANRSAFMAYVYHAYLKGYLFDDEKEVFSKSIVIHGTYLNNLVHDERYKAHNHNMIHSIALFNLSIAFPNLENSPVWKEASRNRISELMREMVYETEGVSVEQAPNYHYYAISLFLKANEILSNFGMGFGESDKELIDKMTDFAALMRYPDGKLPAIGDTPYGSGSMAALRYLYNEGYGTETTSFFYENLINEPADMLFYPQSGYLIFRPSYQADLVAFVDMGPGVQSHGHRDAMNFLLYNNGTPLLVDSGGPYAYDDSSPFRRYVVSTRAHNTVVVDNKNYNPGDVVIKRVHDNSDFSFIEGEHTKYEGVTHVRAVFFIKSGLFIIFDQLISHSDSEHSYDLLYHFPPGSNAQIVDGSKILMVAENGSTLSLAVDASAETTVSVIEGQKEPIYQGWVTTDHREIVPAPVSQFRLTGKDAWFATAIMPFTDNAHAGEMSISAQTDGVDWKFIVDDSKQSRINVILPKDGK